MINLETLLDAHPNMVALTGAGISAASGIPTYRNDAGEWQRSITFGGTDGQNCNWFTGVCEIP